MIIRKLLLLVAAFFLCAAAFSNEWFLYEVTDFAYYPKSDFVEGSTHYAPFTGLYDGVELRTTFHADYKINTPLGDHWLVNGANVVLGTGFELSPITVRPSLSVAFTPVPFLEFSAGTSMGTGWTLMGLTGLGLLDSEKTKEDAVYEDLTPFADWYYDFWGKGTFMFDTGAIWQGDWTHVVMSASYQAIYKGVTGVDNEEIWAWQCGLNNVNGWQYNSVVILAYQMPLVLYRAGFMGEFFGQIQDSDYGPISSRFNGDYMNVRLSLLMQFNLTQKDVLNVLFSFKTRRSFEEEHENAIEEAYLTYSGDEWHFNRIALSWTHKFKK